MSVANNLIGKTLNKRYEILRPLGKGGMGKVYLAKDIRFGKQVVVKVPIMEVGDNEFKSRFMREIASLANLEHPHIVSTLDWGEIEGIPFLVLRYLGGGSLRDRITDSQGLKKQMPLEGLNQWLPQIASALDFIHSKKWVHRDLKPDNILFDEVGNPYLADFGIAKALEGASMGVKTTLGTSVGTPEYMAPEMHLCKGIGAKADQFGLAVLVYESLAGILPFKGLMLTDLFLDVMRGKPKLIHELVSEIPLQKSNALMKGLAKDQDKRHDNCSLFASEITGIKLGIGQLFQGNGEVSISGQIEPLQMKPPIKTGFPAIPDEAPSSMPELPSTKVIRGGVKPLPSQIPLKVEEAPSIPELASTRVIRKGVPPLPSQIPLKVEEDEPFIQNREKNRVSLRIVLWAGGILMLVIALVLVTLVVKISWENRKVPPPPPPEPEPIFLTAPFSAEKAKNAQEKLAKNLDKPLVAKINLGQEVNLDMVLIPAGNFMMGSPASETPRHNDETQHEVTLTKPFYIGKYEVTQDQWKAVMGNNPSKKTRGVKLPVTDVSWEDCQEFIKKLNSKTDGNYRLPTEAEWEYSCRAGTTTAYSYGDRLMKSDANIDSGSIKAVGNYNPNAFGLYAMHGNVWEWCEDWYDSLQEGKVSDPMGSATGKYRVLRGGSFIFLESKARSSIRFNSLPPISSDYDLGFRLARAADLKTGVAPLVPKTEPLVVIPPTVKLLEAPFTETNAKNVQKAVAESLQREVEEKADLSNGVSLDMVLIPAGNFMMGSPESEKGRADHETQHAVTLTKPFYMGKYEVTQKQWESVMGEEHNLSNTKGEKLPVTNVSWEDCQNFIKKLNEKNKGKYRLPTEAEWEYACRAGTEKAYSFGNKITPQDANYESSKIAKPVEVGGYKPNAFGLYDMHGNVWEWCQDYFIGAYPAGAVEDPKGPIVSEFCVLRGGSFFLAASNARSSHRNNFRPDGGTDGDGFRLVMDP